MNVTMKYALDNYTYRVREGHFNLMKPDEVSTSVHIRWGADDYVNISLPEGWWFDKDGYPVEQLREACNEFLDSWISTSSTKVREFLAWLDEPAGVDVTNADLFDHAWELRHIEQKGRELRALEVSLRRLRVSAVANISYFKEVKA